MPYKNRDDYNKFMQKYMKEYREAERQLIRDARKVFGWKPPRRKKPK